MSGARTIPTDDSSRAGPRGLAALAEMLADRHVAIVSSDRHARERIARDLADHLAVRPATVLVHLADGSADGAVEGVPDVAVGDGEPEIEILARAGAGTDGDGRHRTAWRDLDGGRSEVLADALETVALLARTGMPGWRMLFWHDAEEAMTAAPQAFARLLELLLATTVEHEFLQPGDLVLQRLVLLGGPRLAEAVADPGGPFHRWSKDTATPADGAAEGGVDAGLLDPRVLEVEHPRFEIVHV